MANPAPAAPAPAALLPGQPKPLPQAYYVLLARDIFTTKHANYNFINPNDISNTPPPPPQPSGPRNDRPTIPTPPSIDSDSSNNPAYIRELSLVLTGVAGDTGHFVAFIEDQNAMQTLFLKAGDTIARGKIKDVYLDYLDYEHNGRVQRVAIGENLQGRPATLGTPAAPTAAPAAPGAPAVASSPAAPAAAPAPVTGSNTEDIAAKLRRRRQAEGGR